jgi:transglutaminase-like putative cysteine protease
VIGQRAHGSDVGEEPEAWQGGRPSLWDDALTLLIAGASFVAVAVNVQASDWVSGAPLLFPIGLLALFAAYGLARLRVSQLVLVPAGLFAGATVVFLQLMAITPGDTVDARSVALVSRMHHWWYAVSQHGASRDALPIIVIMLAMTWIGAFVAAWAIFRWKNAVLGLVPGAAALTWDAAFSSGQISVTAVLYVILGSLLFMRLRVLREQERWRRDRVAFPRLLALPVLGAALWSTLLLLAAVAILPVGSESSAANARWDSLTAPLTSHVTSVAGAFVGINPDKGAKIHALKDALILQGVITLSDLPAADVSVDLPPDVPPFLRAESFEQYRRDGWQVNGQSEQDLPPGTDADVQDPRDGTSPLLRKPVLLTVTVAGGNGDRLLSIGQPLSSNRSASATTGSERPDVSSIEPDNHLGNGTQYSVIGSASAATADQLRAAGNDYPSWVTQSYLQLPRRLPGRIAEQANEIAGGASNSYDAATSIEAYLRTLPDGPGASPPDRRDPVDYFLFDERSGNFVEHASAMTVMLRTLGIPARLASGYVLDPSTRADGGPFMLTQAQAFTWPEVFFPGAGWVEFNPSPTQPLVARPLVAQTQGPPEPPLPALPPDNGTRVLSIPGGSLLADAASSVSLAEWRDVGLAMLALAVLGGSVYGVGAWELSVRRLSLSERLWEKTVRLASFAYAAPRPHDTPRSYAADLARDVPEAGAAAAYIASRYERTRFGNKDTTAAEARQLRAAWRSARTALLRRILRLDRRRIDSGENSDSGRG